MKGRPEQASQWIRFSDRLMVNPHALAAFDLGTTSSLFTIDRGLFLQTAQTSGPTAKAALEELRDSGQYLPVLVAPREEPRWVRIDLIATIERGPDREYMVHLNGFSASLTAASSAEKIIGRISADAAMLGVGE